MLVRPLIVTVTLTIPVPAGEVVVRVEPLTKMAATELTPKLTVAPAKKFEPVIVTVVPPDDGPVFGLMLVTVGGGGRSSARPLSAKPKVNRRIKKTVYANAWVLSSETADGPLHRAEEKRRAING